MLRLPDGGRHGAAVRSHQQSFDALEAFKPVWKDNGPFIVGASSAWGSDDLETIVEDVIFKVPEVPTKAA